MIIKILEAFNYVIAFNIATHIFMVLNYHNIL